MLGRAKNLMADWFLAKYGRAPTVWVQGPGRMDWKGAASFGKTELDTAVPWTNSCAVPPMFYKKKVINLRDSMAGSRVPFPV